MMNGALAWHPQAVGNILMKKERHTVDGESRSEN